MKGDPGVTKTQTCFVTFADEHPLVTYVNYYTKGLLMWISQGAEIRTTRASASRSAHGHGNTLRTELQKAAFAEYQAKEKAATDVLGELSMEESTNRVRILRGNAHGSQVIVDSSRC